MLKDCICVFLMLTQCMGWVRYKETCFDSKLLKPKSEGLHLVMTFLFADTIRACRLVQDIIGKRGACMRVYVCVCVSSPTCACGAVCMCECVCVCL
jgi:hypothetical protein